MRKGYFVICKHIVLVACVGLMLFSLPISSVGATKSGGDASLPNHYIVLFDASGSMSTDYRKHLWEKEKRLSKMAPHIQRIVWKALLPPDPPDGFRPIAKGDYLSFLYFRLDWSKPSYALNDMFVTGNGLALHKVSSLPSKRMGLSLSSGYFARVDRRGFRFGGHSPLVAATKMAIPYLGQRLASSTAKPKAVGKIILIRITDGSYNTLSNPADEFAAIRKAVQIQRNKGRKLSFPAGFDEYRRQAVRMDRVFDLGKVTGECALRVNGVSNPLGRRNKPKCGPKAFESVKSSGDGLLFSYREAVPRLPSENLLAQVSSERVTLEWEAQDGKVYYVGKNQVRAEKWQDKETGFRVAPEAVRWNITGRTGELTDAACFLTESAEVMCRADSHMPGDDSGVIRLKKEKDLGDEFTAEYTFRYRATFEGAPPVYPFSYQLAPYKKSVALIPRELEKWETIHYSQDADAKPRPITDKALGDFSKQKGRAVRPGELARWSRERFEKLRVEDVQSGVLKKQIFAASGLGAILLLIGFLVFWPYRKLRLIGQDRDSDTIVVDFNQASQHASVIGGFSVENHAHILLLYYIPFFGRRLFNKPFYNRAFSLPMAVQDVEFRESEGEIIDEKIRWRESEPEDEIQIPPVWVGQEGRVAYTDTHAVGGKSYSLFFGQNLLEDVNIGRRPRELTVAVSYSIFVKKTKPQELARQLTLRLIPEQARFEFEKAPLVKHTLAPATLRADYQYGQREQVLRHRLINRAGHAFGYPATGAWRLEARGIKDGEIVEDAFLLTDEHGEELPGNEFHYEILPRTHTDLHVVVVYDRLENPMETVGYRIQLSNDGKVEDEWQLLLERSRDRTDVELEILTNKKHTLISPGELHRNPQVEHTLDENKQGRIPVHTGGAESVNTTTLLYLRLANRCQGGHGFADWSASMETRGTGGDFPFDAFVLQDNKGHTREGRLTDSPDATKRERTLALVMQNSKVRIDQRDMALTLTIQIDWRLYPNGAGGDTESLRTKAILHLPLRHIPAHHVLAVDFGTSAIAMGHAIGEDTHILDLHRQSERILDEARISRALFYGHESNTPFLCSDASLRAIGEVAPCAPNSPKYLDLPASKRTIAEDPLTLMLALKSLIAAGRTYLDIPTAKYPYLNHDGELEKRLPPPIGEVLEGAYKGLLESYITPILQSQGKDYAHLVVTHPNTYTLPHLDMLREIIEAVFLGAGGPNRIYKENIHYLSESDAVAYYYLAHANEYWGDWDRIPEQERILIYDIGAGTLDLTLLTVKRKVASGGVRYPAEMRIERRSGANKAGNLLDECIARDLDVWLRDKLGDLYANRIVADRPEPGDSMTLATMLELRNQIQILKQGLSAQDEAPELIFAGSVFEDLQGLVSTKSADLARYRETDGLRVEPDGAVVWCPGADLITEGAYVKTLIEKLTYGELMKFFDNKVPNIDTVVLSGRTSLWPGFQEKLKQTLPDVRTWVCPLEDTITLKQMVVEGALIRLSRWSKLEIHDPKIFGHYEVRYEKRGPGDWESVPLEKGKPVSIPLVNAATIRIGLRNPNGFIEALAFDAKRFDNEQQTMDLTIDYTPYGNFGATIRRPDDLEAISIGSHDVHVLPHGGIRPWPMENAILKRIPPEKIGEDFHL